MPNNTAIITGRLTKDPLFTKGRESTSDRVWFVLAIPNFELKDKEPDYVPVTMWGVHAQNAAKYLEKGQQVTVKGRIEIRRVEKDGITKDFFGVRGTRIQYGPKARKDKNKDASVQEMIAAEVAKALANQDHAQESAEVQSDCVHENADADCPF